MTDPTNVQAVPSAEMAIGLAGLVAPAIAEPAKTVALRWLTDKKRVEHYQLLYPFMLDGLVYKDIDVRRLTAAEVATFVERLRESSSNLRFPMFYVGDAELTDVAWAAMDDDDRFALEAIGDAFLPARFRRPTDAS